MNRLSEYHHTPVMVRESVEYLLSAPGETYIDATLGDGGHAEALLNRNNEAVLYGIDRDPEAIKASRKRLAKFNNRANLILGRFGNLFEIARENEINSVSGVLFDLGISSRQLDDRSRGFSFDGNGKLNMRMDGREERKTAFDIINQAKFEELKRILTEYGEQRGAIGLSKAIIKARERSPIETSIELKKIVENAIRNCKASDLARVFQAFRIAINGELQELRDGLDAAMELLVPGGILVVISYHSLEDRIVKRFMVREEQDCICPPDLPVCRCGHRKRLERLSRKPETPSSEEIDTNSRARSAKLRVARKL